MTRKLAEFAGKIGAYLCIILGLPVAFSLHQDELLTGVVLVGGLTIFAGGWWWLIRLRRKYG